MILGHERQIKYFDRLIAAGRLGHAYLLHGPERVGKRAIAQAIARALLCPNRAKNSLTLADASDDCSVCRQIITNIHQDVIVLDRTHTLLSDKEKRSEIPIEDIRELKRRFAFAPAGNAWRIAIIGEVATMSTDAQVAFLKILEEPGTQTLFLLTSQSRDAVPPTIVSRATPVLFAPVPDEILASYIQTHLQKENTVEILAMARGRAGAVIEWARDSESIRREKKSAALFEKSFAGGIAEILALSEQIAGDEPARRRAQDAWIWHLRRGLSVPSASTTERRSAARRIARALDLAGIMDKTNVNPRLAMDVMFTEGS